VIAKVNGRDVRTKLVVMEEVPFWAKVGWHFICADPEDEFALIYWLETDGRR